MNRRSFIIKSAVAITASAVGALASKPDLPVLHGDGWSDDTKAMSALYSGKQVLWKNEVLEAKDGVVHLPHGMFRCTDRLVICGSIRGL